VTCETWLIKQPDAIWDDDTVTEDDIWRMAQIDEANDAAVSREAGRRWRQKVIQAAKAEDRDAVLQLTAGNLYLKNVAIIVLTRKSKRKRGELKHSRGLHIKASRRDNACYWCALQSCAGAIGPRRNARRS
jgi:hypothetical protein